MILTSFHWRRKRRDFVVGSLQAIPGVECFTPPGAFYVLPKVSATYGKSATKNGKTYHIKNCDDLVMYLLGMFKCCHKLEDLSLITSRTGLI